MTYTYLIYLLTHKLRFMMLGMNLNYIFPDSYTLSNSTVLSHKKILCKSRPFPEFSVIALTYISILELNWSFIINCLFSVLCWFLLHCTLRIAVPGSSLSSPALPVQSRPFPWLVLIPWWHLHLIISSPNFLWAPDPWTKWPTRHLFKMF